MARTSFGIESCHTRPTDGILLRLNRDNRCN